MRICINVNTLSQLLHTHPYSNDNMFHMKINCLSTSKCLLMFTVTFILCSGSRCSPSARKVANTVERLVQGITCMGLFFRISDSVTKTLYNKVNSGIFNNRFIGLNFVNEAAHYFPQLWWCHKRCMQIQYGVSSLLWNQYLFFFILVK